MTPSTNPPKPGESNHRPGASAESVAFRVCMVCTGNICRSPMAEVVLEALADEAGVADLIEVTSAGTGDWHVGEQADPRTIQALSRHGFDGSSHRARQFDDTWFDTLDLVVAMDRSHERALRSLARDYDDLAKIRLFSSFDSASPTLDIADPYYSNEAAFDAVLGQIRTTAGVLFTQLKPAFEQGAAERAAQDKA